MKQRKQFEAGWYQDMSNEDYHGSAGLSSSSLKVLAEKTMAHLNYHRDNPTEEQSRAMVTGQLLHTMTLEPHLVDVEFGVRPLGLEKPSKTVLKAANPSPASQKKISAWNTWQEELGQKIEVTEQEYKNCKAMAKSVREHPIMGQWFSDKINGIGEQSIFHWYRPEDWDEGDYKTMVKIRPDWIMKDHSVIFDLKSTRDAAFSNFFKQARKLYYHMSAGMYLDVANQCQPFLEHCGVFAFTSFVWVVVENEPPFEATYYEASEKDIAEGKTLYHNLVRRADRYNRSKWKGYGEQDENGLYTPTGRKSEFPGWSYNVV